MNTNENQDFGQTLKSLLKKADLKYNDLARVMGVSRQTVVNWCNNYSLPSTHKLLKLSRFFTTNTLLTTVTEIKNND